MTKRKPKTNVDLLQQQIEQVAQDFALQREAILRTVTNPSEKYRCHHTGKMKTRKRTRVLKLNDSRVTDEQRQKLADVSTQYTQMMVKLEASVRASNNQTTGNPSKITESLTGHPRATEDQVSEDPDNQEPGQLTEDQIAAFIKGATTSVN